MTIKLATFKDKEQIIDILYELALYLKDKKIEQWQEWLAPKESDLNWITDLINNSSFFLILKDNTTIGIFSLADQDAKYWGKSNDKSKYLHSLGILPQFKNNEIGKTVISLIKTQLKEKDYTFLRLDCISSNQKLKNYYLNQEFDEVGITNIGPNSFTLFQYTL